ncbi:hypothetical protein GCM10022281_22800 [Sphingomonas rosea]|uniref:Uncharacterized protein n=1 Tax=Sphingomonas rosea TaxID=335605 RepID=A0ABP7UE13_9SPHN
MIEFALLAVAAATQPVAPPAPPAPPPVIPIPAPPSPVRPDRLLRPPVAVQVRVSGAGRVLFADTLRVGPIGANFQQSQREAGEQLCSTGLSTSSRNLQLSVQPTYDNAERYRVSVSWSRPVGSGCDVGSRTASADQSVLLPPGQTVRIEGDGGLLVELTRR